MTGTITNSSSISFEITLSGGGTLINTSSGTVSTSSYAVYGAPGSADTVINAGVLVSTLSSAVVLSKGGVVQNAGGALIEGVNAGVRIVGAAGSRRTRQEPGQREGRREDGDLGGHGSSVGAQPVAEVAGQRAAAHAAPFNLGFQDPHVVQADQHARCRERMRTA